MSATLPYAHRDPTKIVIKRETRQRQENIKDVEDLKLSIVSLRKKRPNTGGLINPVIIRQEEGADILVAGERRLTAFIELGLTDIPVRDFADLDPQEAEVVELEENVKRKDLHWRDYVRAVGRIHLLHKQNAANWRIEQTAEAVSLNPVWVRKILHVFDALDTGKIDKAEGIEQAYNTLHKFSERKAEAIVGDLIAQGAAMFGTTTVASPPAAAPVVSSDTITTTSAIAVAPEQASQPSAQVVSITTNVVSSPIAPPPPPPEPVLCTNFIEWVQNYSGPKFSLIHCDFPYGNYKGGDSTSLNSMETEEFYDNDENVYWTLLSALTENLDRIMSYSAHMIFWFNMNFYTETVRRLRSTGLFVHDHPLIWHKTGGGGGLGVVPGTATTYPRRTYDTALLAVRGNRPLAKPMMNSYPSPTVSNKIHPSQKPEPMLRFFLSGVVDETTTMLDPTCGSAASLRAAEDLGARHVLGIEMDLNYAKLANSRTLQARVMRQGNTMIRKDEAALL